MIFVYLQLSSRSSSHCNVNAGPRSSFLQISNLQLGKHKVKLQVMVLIPSHLSEKRFPLGFKCPLPIVPETLDLGHRWPRKVPDDYDILLPRCVAREEQPRLRRSQQPDTYLHIHTHTSTHTLTQAHIHTSHTRMLLGAHGIMVMYDLTDNSSFANVKKWLQEVRRVVRRMPPPDPVPKGTIA